MHLSSPKISLLFNLTKKAGQDKPDWGVLTEIGTYGKIWQEELMMNIYGNYIKRPMSDEDAPPPSIG